VPPRFHAPALAPDVTRVTLDADQSRHLSRVLRLGHGDTVEVFDGRGRMAVARVVDPDTRAATVEVVGDAPAQPEAPVPLVVCAALLKGDAMDAVVRDATVLGATRIVPMSTARTNVPASRIGAGRLEQRWTRVAVAAAKQCGRARVPDIAPVRQVAEVIGDAAWRRWDRRLLVEPSRVATVTSAQVSGPFEGPSASSRHADASCEGLVVAIGPEGGWTGEEVRAALDAGWHAWSLGPFTLRAEQMALAALAVVRYGWLTAPPDTP
jgi:16S rRNA (uracil1498-N3)-methyltransferase